MLSILRCLDASFAQICIKVLDDYGRETLGEKNLYLGCLTPGCYNVTIFSFHRKQMRLTDYSQCF